MRPELAGHRLITWEPRGLGRSACPPGPYSVATWADDLRALMDALSLERAHVWALGFGSYIAHRFAAVHPERVGALVTYTDVWARDPQKRYPEIWEVYSAIVRNFGTTGFGARVLANVFDVSDVPWFGRWEARNIEEVLHPETVDRTVGHCLTEADVREDLAGIRSPTLVLMGDRTWDGRTIDPADDGSLTLMREQVPGPRGAPHRRRAPRLRGGAEAGRVRQRRARVPRAPPAQLTRGSACSSGGASPSATSAKCRVAGSASAS